MRTQKTLLLPTLLLMATATCTTSESDPFQQPPPQACDAEVCVDRDAYGTPFIYAESLPAAAYGLGYAQAEDHAVAIVGACLKASGRLAELTGTAAVASDMLMHALHIPERSSALYPKLSQDLRDYIEAFAAGVNRYLDEHRNDEQLSWIGDYRLSGEAVFAPRGHRPPIRRCAGRHQTLQAEPRRLQDRHLSRLRVP